VRARTRKRQYQVEIDVGQARGYVPVVPTAGHGFRTDPRRLGTGVMLLEVASVHGIGSDPVCVDWCRDRAKREALDAGHRLDVIEQSREDRFSMHDEVVHTGFSPMAHALFGMGVGIKK
jgi:hypothetical protein